LIEVDILRALNSMQESGEIRTSLHRCARHGALLHEWTSKTQRRNYSR